MFGFAMFLASQKRKDETFIFLVCENIILHVLVGGLINSREPRVLA